ncbi:MAG: TIGR04222 domain-containing membrane protein [Planctomycetota bacterium]
MDGSNPKSVSINRPEGFEAFARRVERFDIDPGDKALSFTDRLARENDWTRGLAARVVREYKRFCVLAMRAGHPVTPSEFVDQAWHLHLTYTRSYWQRFCGEALGGPLHHEPTAGGNREGEKYRDWYATTLESYRRLFGEEPPEAIWPTPAARFRHAGQWRWINVGHHWVIPRNVARLTMIVVVVAIALVAIPGCRIVWDGIAAPPLAANAMAWGLFPFNLGGASFLIFYAVVSAVIAGVVLSLRLSSPEQSGDTLVDPDSKDLTPDELAVLSGGGSRLAHLAMTRLFMGKSLDVKKSWFSSKLVALQSPKEVSSLDRDLYQVVESQKSTNQLMSAVKPHFDRINRDLQARGLRRTPGWFSRYAFGLILAVVLLGVLRLIQGVSKGEEVGLLLVMMVVFLVVSMVLNYRSQGPTRAGQLVIENAKHEATRRQTQAGEEVAKDSILYDVAVLGAVGLASDAALSPIATMFPHVGQNTSGSGCGAGCSGCGGGGCGGGGCGGGGCGGCGG